MDVVIAGAARTPTGAFNGSLGSVPAHYLGEVAIREALKRAGVEPGEVSEVVLGQVLTAGTGQNPARQAAVNAGIPVEKTAYAINQLCGSGLRTVALGFQAIRTGDAEIVVAGGQESMSQAPHCMHLRNGTKMGDTQLIDTMIRDGLWDAFNGYHMGTTAENVAQKWQITREQQDQFATASQNKAEAAIKAGRFKDEIVAGHHQGPQGRHHRRYRRVPQGGRHGRGPGEAAPGLFQGWLGHGGQCFGHQRRCRGPGADGGGCSIQARHHAAGPHRVVGDRRRRSRGDGLGSDPGQPRWRSRRPAGRWTTST